jgi:3-methylcrotonyl-CoA carboxylase alpha subunit
MFDKILIANRGEIAVRVIRTARRLGVRTVAVHSEADTDAMHVEAADEAVCVGPAAASASYLRGESILEAARRTGARAIHPGYGFLSENAGFAAACAEAGIVFIGPPVEAIRIMGSKSESKRVMALADVPLVPGYHGADQDEATLTAEAGRIGWPVLVKASAGGGGKGMRVVRDPAGLADAIAGARREARAAFGDDTLLLEKYLTRPRHVEIQVFADTHGNVVALHDRDCSIQRRHQKVIEEAPAPALADGVRARMAAAAVAAARAIGYVGAGTVEFLYEDGAFYFIEMNTRLQVEHPVTEMITGVDLVEWQLRVASGEPLPMAQGDIPRRGHALEARVYAEDPQRDFLPATGRLIRLRPPAASPYVRVDTGVREGDEVSVHYDPMIAKLIVWDETREGAVRRMRSALAAYEVVGVATNIAFLGAIAGHGAFLAEEIDTGFIERHRAVLLPALAPAPDRALAAAALAVLERRKVEAGANPGPRAGDPYSPWHSVTGWRLNEENHQDLRFHDGDTVREVALHYDEAGHRIVVDGRAAMSAGPVVTRDGTLSTTLDGVRLKATVVPVGADVTIILDGAAWRLRVDDPLARAGADAGGSGRLSAPMPGTVVNVMVEAGQTVSPGQPLMLLEAMKMEHTITAPAAGTVTAVHFAAGDRVSEGVELLVLELARDE